VAPDMKNAGWAIAPDIECVAGMYCPYACAPGKVMAQWKKGSTYTYPDSMVRRSSAQPHINASP